MSGARGGREREAGRAPGERRRALALFLTFAGFYLLTASGHFYAADEESVFRLTESIVERRTLTMPDGVWGAATTTGRDGRQYAVYEPGQSVLAVPLYLLGVAAAPLLPPGARGHAVRFAAGLFNQFVTAATVALLYLLARRLGYGGRAALGLAASYGLATFAWPHGRTFLTEPLTALLLLLALYAFRRGTEDPPAPGWLVAGGAATVGALAVKPHAALAVPFLGLYLLGRAAAPRLVAGRVQIDARRAVRLILAGGVGMAIVALPLAVYHTLLFGHPLRTGYGAQSPADLTATPFLTGLYGLTLSSGKGIIWYAPPVALALAGWWRFARGRRAEALACAGIVLAHLAFYSGFLAWHGDGSWGPRYLMVMLPFAVLPLVAVLDGLRARPFRLALVGAVVAAGVAVQILGATVNFDWYILRSAQDTRHFTPAASPILAHPRMLADRLGAWRGRAFPPPDSATLTAGFAAGEPPAGGGRPTVPPLFPRWTTGAGEIALRPAAREPLTVKLTFFDHRPPALRADRPAILIDGAALGEGAIERRDLTGDGEGWAYQFVVPADALGDGRATVTLQSTPWNPQKAGQGDRDETLGVFVHNVEVWRGGRPLVVGEALPIVPMPDTPRQRFWWFNDDRDFYGTRPHLIDHWAWYTWVAGFPRAGATAWIAGYGLLSGAVLLAGLALGWRALPLTVRRPRIGAARGRARPKRRRVAGAGGGAV